MAEILKHNKYPKVIKRKDFYSRNLICIYTVYACGLAPYAFS